MVTWHRFETTEPTGPQRAAPPELSVSALIHLFAGGWILAMVLFARFDPDRYAASMQEDRAVEWWTMLLFAVAGVVRLRRATRDRQLFEGLVALFCVFVAGEEISWGQRLLGVVPPAPFLAHNTQQEMNLHNFADVFGKPKWMLAFALFGYGVLLPAIHRSSRGRAVGRRLGVAPTHPALAPWFLACVGLLVWYPQEFTGEWVECLAGVLFLASAGVGARTLLTATTALALAAFVLSSLGARGSAGDAARLSCVRSEVDALTRDMARAASPRLLDAGTIHKRVWTATRDGYLNGDRLAEFRQATCRGAGAHDADARRRYIVDPWGTAYWIKSVRTTSGGRQVVVYSFGPNRRRDGDADALGAARRDDVVARTIVGSPLRGP